MAETLRQAKAFDLYYAMGEQRSYEKVSRQIGVSKNSIYKWANVFGWAERIKQRDAENAQRLYEETNASVIDKYRQYNKIIDGAIAKGIEKLKKGEMDIQASDLIRLIDLGIKINGIIDGEEKTTQGNSGVTFNFNLSKS